MAERAERERLHHEELPIALLTATTASMNRDPKKRPEPYSIDDFTIWGKREDQPQPPAAAGAALQALVDGDLLPGWAVGPWCIDLAKVAEGHKPPARLVLASQDAILLAPWRSEARQWSGFLIARREALGKRQAFYSDDGLEVMLYVPPDAVPNGAVGARDGVTLGENSA